jgi:hypothetical protein
MTFQQSWAFEHGRCARPRLCGNEALRGSTARFAGRCIIENALLVTARADGENDFAARNIRNSISLTMRQRGRMICASHQRGG